MTIEIRQLVIKSTLLTERRQDEGSLAAPADLERLKESLLVECRELIAERFSELRER